jgi:hypothetical protein
MERRQGVWLINPGAAGPPRFDLRPSLCILEWEPKGNLLRFDFQQFEWK